LDGDEPVGIGIRQWRKQDGVDYRENRGVRANAKGEREHGHEGEPGRFAKLANGVAKSVHGNFRFSILDF
jgi:hypothetical protein